MKYIIANWKSNKTVADVETWIKEFIPFYQKSAKSDLQIVLCPSFVHLALVHQLLPELQLGAQTISPYPSGAYTGAISAAMVKEFAQYVILGHVERRQFFNETDQMVALQAVQALDNGLTPILAVNNMNWSIQLSQLSNEQLAKCLVMYEPPEAISTNGQGHAADLDKVKMAIELITESYTLKGVLYGGSVASGNIAEYMNDETVSGVVAGNATLDAKEFVSLIEASNI